MDEVSRENLSEVYWGHKQACRFMGVLTLFRQNLPSITTSKCFLIIIKKLRVIMTHEGVIFSNVGIMQW